MPRRGRARYRGTFQPVTGGAGTGNSGSTGAAIVGQFVGEVDHSNTVRVSGRRLFNQYSSNEFLPLAVVWNHHQFVGGNQFSRGGHDTFTGLVGMSASAGGIVVRGQPSSPPPEQAPNGSGKAGQQVAAVENVILAKRYRLRVQAVYGDGGCWWVGHPDLLGAVAEATYTLWRPFQGTNCWVT